MQYFLKAKNIFIDVKDKYYNIDHLQILDKLYWIDKPDDLENFSYFLNNKFNDDYKIWNVSENKYDKEIFKGKIIDYVNTGYPNPALKDIYFICKEITSWIDSEINNIAIIHCQKSKSRSIMILSCLLFFLKNKKHPSEAYEYIKYLRNDLNCLMNNNKLYMKYFSCLIEQSKLNSCKIEIKNIIISNIPKINLLPDHYQNPLLRETPNFLPYIQIFQKKEILFNDLDNIFLKKEDDKNKFKINKIVDGDILIRIRHFLSSDVRYQVLRLMINTGFLQQGINNFSSDHIDFGETIFIDNLQNFHLSIEVDIKYDMFSNEIMLLEQLRNNCTNFAIIENEENLKNKNLEEVYSIGEDEDDFKMSDDENINKINDNIEIDKKINNNERIQNNIKFKSEKEKNHENNKENESDIVDHYIKELENNV